MLIYVYVRYEKLERLHDRITERRTYIFYSSGICRFDTARIATKKFLLYTEATASTASFLTMSDDCLNVRLSYAISASTWSLESAERHRDRRVHPQQHYVVVLVPTSNSGLSRFIGRARTHCRRDPLADSPGNTDRRNRSTTLEATAASDLIDFVQISPRDLIE